MFGAFLFGAGLGEAIGGTLLGDTLAMAFLAYLVGTFFVFPFWLLAAEARIGWITNYLPAYTGFALGWVVLVILIRAAGRQRETRAWQAPLAVCLALLSLGIVVFDFFAHTQLGLDRQTWENSAQGTRPMPYCERLVGKPAKAGQLCLRTKADGPTPMMAGPNLTADINLGLLDACEQGLVYLDYGKHGGDTLAGPSLIAIEGGPWRKWPASAAQVTAEPARYGFSCPKQSKQIKATFDRTCRAIGGTPHGLRYKTDCAITYVHIIWDRRKTYRYSIPMTNTGTFDAAWAERNRTACADLTAQANAQYGGEPIGSGFPPTYHDKTGVCEYGVF